MNQPVFRSGQDRIACPQCRANNFPGQPRCWQCGASLPPQDALNSRPSPGPQGSPMPFPARPGPGVASPPRLLWGLVLAGVALVSFLAVFLLVNRRAANEKIVWETPRRSEPALAPAPAPDATNAANEAPARPENSDPLTDQAKREIQRAQRDLAIPAPDSVSGKDGRIHLRSGGTISADEWERARRKVQESPYFRDPATPNL